MKKPQVAPTYTLTENDKQFLNIAWFMSMDLYTMKPSPYNVAFDKVADEMVSRKFFGDIDELAFTYEPESEAACAYWESLDAAAATKPLQQYDVQKFITDVTNFFA